MQTEQDIQNRINEIDLELSEIENLKKRNHFSSEDLENMSDNYQFHIEWNHLLLELNDERKGLIQERSFMEF